MILFHCGDIQFKFIWIFFYIYQTALRPTCFNNNSFLNWSPFRSDMHSPTLQNVTFWRATRCGWCIFEKKIEKMTKITISWCKMYKPGNSGWNQISVLPDDSITRHEHFFFKYWWFLAFSWIYLAIFGKQYLVARQNVTFWRVGKNMSGSYRDRVVQHDVLFFRCIRLP